MGSRKRLSVRWLFGHGNFPAAPMQTAAHMQNFFLDGLGICVSHVYEKEVILNSFGIL